MKKLGIRYTVAAAATVFALSVGAGEALADNLTVTDVEMTVNPADVLTVMYTSAFPNIVENVDVSAYVGQVTLSGGTGTNAFSIPAWCVDLFHDVSLGSGQNLAYAEGALTTNNAVPTSTPLTPTQIAEISGLISYGDGLLNVPALATPDNSAAVQLAIWSVEYGTNFSYSGGTTDLYENYMNVLGMAPGLLGSAAGLMGIDGQQSFGALYATTGDTSPVPEPASLALLGVGVIGLGALGRKRAA